MAQQDLTTNGHDDMVDAVAGADVNGTEVEVAEPQRIRVVSCCLYTIPFPSTYASSIQ
jgi:hypothetical protein